jgi:signal transduction histidine kinase/DNA-binding response OmpR family regulator
MKKTKILYIEDDARQLRTLADQLKANGFDVFATSSGKQGLAYFCENSVSAIVCDLHMPELDGIAVLEKACEINPEIPFILLTANGSIPEAVNALKIGAFDFLLKPVDIDQLKNTISHAIEHKKLENELKNYSRSLEIMVRERTEKLEYSNRQLSALNDVSNKFTQIFDEESLYDEVPHLLCQSLDFDRSSLFLETNGELALRSFCFAKDEDLTRQIRAKMKTGTLEIPRPLVECFATCKTLFIENPNEDPRWPKSDDVAKRTKSIAVTPLKAQGICVGLLVANMEHHEREMDQQDIARFEMFARMVGLAVDNIRAYKSLEKKVIERTQSLRAANKKLRAKTNELEKTNYSLGNANVDLLAFQEELVFKNDELKNTMDTLEKINKELRETQSQLVQSEKMAALGNLVAGIAHEINTPVGAINSMHNTAVRAVEKLKVFFQNTLPSELSEDRKLLGALKIIEDSNDIIKTGTERVINIVRRLRSFARLDEAEVKEVDIHEGLEDTLTLAYHELKHRVTVHKNFGDLPRISCYPGRLNQVFLNMIVNANQAIKDRGELTITTYRKNDKVYIEIKDTGVGIPKKNLKKIFDPGFTTKGVGVGTGLGLSICYRIIQDHQGEIKVKSDVGMGTTFTIILPMDLNKRLGVS